MGFFYLFCLGTTKDLFEGGSVPFIALNQKGLSGKVVVCSSFEGVYFENPDDFSFEI